MMSDDQLMLKVLRLALKGTGQVSPNPRVGAVITKDGKIIGEGYHKKFGDDHAEINAIKNSGLDDFTGCTMYVNLEPCSHEGKTPACAPVLIQKNFSRVVIGMVDPNPLVSGAGIQMLQKAGIDVVAGVLENQCKWMNRFFIKHITTGIPYVILKAGQSLDGCIATKNGESKWITSKESRKMGHAIRAEVDAVIIGKNTVLKDNPRLNVRELNGRDPKKVIFDTNLEISLELEIFKSEGRAKTIVCCSDKASKSHKAEALRVAGVSICTVKQDDDIKLNIPDALIKLSQNYGISSVLVEGGGAILSAFVTSTYVDEINLFIAPIIIGNGIRAFGEYSISDLDDAFKMKMLSSGRSGPDTHITLVNKNQF